MSERMSKKMIIHISPSLHKRIKHASHEEGVSMSEFIRASVSQRLDLKTARLGVLESKDERKAREY